MKIISEIKIELTVSKDVSHETIDNIKSENKLSTQAELLEFIEDDLYYKLKELLTDKIDADKLSIDLIRVDSAFE